MKPKTKRRWNRLVSMLLCVAMLAPNVTPIVAEAAFRLESMPRYVDFSRPRALTLGEIGIATDAVAMPEDPGEEPDKTENSGQTGSFGGSGSTGQTGNSSSGSSGSISQSGPASGPAGEAPKASPANADKKPAGREPAELREPEFFYDSWLETDEPDGRLVQFDEERNIRTYEQAEGEYITVIGGYSGLYRDEDGRIRSADNRILQVGKEDREDEADWDPADTASPANARRASVSRSAVRRASSANADEMDSYDTDDADDTDDGDAAERKASYYNAGGSLQVRLPGTWEAEPATP